MMAAELVTALLNGNPRALARLLTHIENAHPQAAEMLAELYPHTGRAHIIGVTGAPGTGKSSLVNSLAKAFRAAGRTVGIIAVDPTSPFSGGAVLGDRIRMRDLSGDPGVFIRSMATRGSLGGLARASGDVARALDAAGFDIVLIETVGAGQSEVDIAREAQTTLVVEAPGLGDDVQAIKAGILEVADILVVNKADRPGAQSTVRALKAMLHLGATSERAEFHHGRLLHLEAQQQAAAAPPQPHDGWQVPVLITVATADQGIDTLLQTIDAHYTFLNNSGLRAWRERQRLGSELESRLRDALLDRLLQQLDPAALHAMFDRLAARELDPYSAVQEMISAFAAQI